MNPNQTDIFRPLFAELDRQLAGNVPVRLAIEGGSASGKTTLGQILAERYGCTVFHSRAECEVYKIPAAEA